ncbi:GntR family transcriptional regulator [Acidisoma silvae]|nr:GntR family transcriptional regulator [Acidisoma silvae]
MVAEALQAAVRSGAISGGAILRPSAIAEAFEISRVPVLRALATLEQSGLVARRSLRGFVVAGPIGAEHNLSKAEIQDIVPHAMQDAVRFRTWRNRIYPDLEREVAGRLLFGHFQIKTQALAQHYRVSRTVANELLVGLERVGIVRRESNARWYAGPLTRDHIVELFELRILLEPAALLQAATVVTLPELSVMQQRVVDALQQKRACPPPLLHQLEIDLHHGVVLRCANSQLRDVLYRCQLPLITSHLAFGIEQDRPEVPPMLYAHAEILAAMLDRDFANAASALAEHLRQSRLEASARILRVPSHIGRPPSYMQRV